MEKKDYQEPMTRVIKSQMQTHLLTGSKTPATSLEDFTWDD